MRLIFTAYAINAALICFLLTVVLAWGGNDEEAIERSMCKLFSYTYVIFGPGLMIVSGVGLYNIKSLAFECNLTYIDRSQVNTMDIFIVVGAALFSTLITLFYSIQ